MRNPASYLLLYATSLTLAFLGSWLFVWFSRRSERRLVPEVGAVLRVRAASGVYRSRVVSLNPSFWTISAPVQRDNYVPIKPGENVIVEVAGSKGALIFRTTIEDREPDANLLTLVRPARIHRVERRSNRRWPQLAGSMAAIEGEPAEILDISEGGARLKSSVRTYKGDRVRLNLPRGQEVYGWVLSLDGNEVRLRFEELLEVTSDIKETAPVF